MIAYGPRSGRVRRVALAASVVVAIASIPGGRVNAQAATAEFPALPGKAVGVLQTLAPAILAAEGRSGPPDALYFASGEGRERWVYVPDRESPRIGTLSIPVPAPGGTTALERFDHLSLATSGTVRRWDVTRPLALVEVEVNGGKGSPAGADRFVATSIRLLDGTPEYPVKPVEVIAALRARYETALRDPRQEALIAREMETARRQALGDERPTGPRETEETTRVTWLPDASHLRVEFRTRITDGLYRTGQGTQPTVKVGPRPSTRYGTAFGVELGTIYEVDRTGREVSARAIPPRTFVKHLAPPAGQRAVPLRVAPPRSGPQRPE